VVKDNGGILELYESIYVWNSSEAAQGFLGSLTTDYTEVQTVGEAPATPVAIQMGDAAIAYHFINGPDDGLHESVYVVGVREGDETLLLRFQGGATFGTTVITNLTSEALAALNRSCGSQAA
jgi:hypothetical protein